MPKPQVVKNETDKDIAENEAVAEKTRFKIKRNITLPLLKLSIGKPVYIRIDSEMFVGKQIKETDADGKQRKPPFMVNITDLNSGEEMQMIVNTVMHSILNEEFPKASYIGKGFQITKHAKENGKDYNPFSVAELDLS